MYADSLTLARARAEFFAQTGHSDSEYSSWIAKIKLGPIPFYFYNFKARREAIAIHDVHHILTGYDTSLLGEYHISAWELGSGYKPMDLAFGYLLLGLFGGLLLDRKRTLEAYIRGLECRNLYGQRVTEEMLGKTLTQLRRELGLQKLSQNESILNWHTSLHT